MYSMGAIYRKYFDIKLPKYFPNSFHYEHGWYSSNKAVITDMDIPQKLMFVMNERRKKIYEDELKRLNIKKDVIVTGSPFFMYRKLMKLEKSKTAKGTIVFPSHSTYDIEVRYNIENFCKELESLPEKYKPFKVCLHWCDYKKTDIVNKYKSLGYEVVTAGFPNRSNDIKFVERYYDILSSVNYSISNEIGTYTFYSVEMGIPFSLIDENGLVRCNNGDVNLNNWNIKDEFKLSDISPIVNDAEEIFTGINDIITNEQREFVEIEMGIREQKEIDISEINKKIIKNYWTFNYGKFFIKLLIKVFKKIKKIMLKK